MPPRSVLFSGLLAAFTLVSNVSFSAEIKVLSANVFTGVLDGHFRDFERSSGHKVVFDYATAGNIKNRVQSGEFGDVAITTRLLMDELERDGKIVRGTTTNIARSTMALIVQSGAPKPDISSTDAFKRALLAANSITYPNPARGGPTGVVLPLILERLKSAAEVNPKTKFAPPGHFALELVAKGEAEVAIGQPMEALLQPGVEIVGPLPSELQSPPHFTFVVGQMTIAKEPDAAHSLTLYLIGPAVQQSLKSKGMEPGMEK